MELPISSLLIRWHPMGYVWVPYVTGTQKMSQSGSHYLWNYPDQSIHQLNQYTHPTRAKGAP